MQMRSIAALTLLLMGTIAVAVPAQSDPVQVVTSLTTYATIAREIGGDRAEVTAIARGDENPHFVQPKPSFVLLLRRADLFVTTGLDLELWVPALMDKAGNAKIRTGNSGYAVAYTGVNLMDVPAAVTRAEGDIHVFGNPHIWTDPINAIIIGGNILAGLKRVAPANASYFEQRYAAWREKVIRAYVGSALVDLLGVDEVIGLAQKGTLWDFLARDFQGRPLTGRLGGWLKQGEIFRNQRMVCYHKEWDYFSRAFRIPCVEYIEPKPGIPPTPRHVAEVISLMRDQNIPVLFSTNYYDRNQVETVARRTGATAVIVPSNTDGAPGTETYIELVSLWVTELTRAFRGRTTVHP